MSGKTLTIAQIVTMLAAAPAHIAEHVLGLTEAQLSEAPAPGEWSALEVLAHLRACADVWGDCIVTIIQHDAPTIRAVNPRTWIERTDYREQAFRPSLQAFAVQRAELLAVLESLEPERWSRPATVVGAGTPLQRTVQTYAQWMARHERPHLKQISRTVDTLRTEH